jgi:hypothetical protein
MERRKRIRSNRQHGGVAVDARVRVYPGTDAEDGGRVVEDFGEAAGQAVDVGNVHIADPARRWAVMLDAGNLVFVDSDQLIVEESQSS